MHADIFLKEVAAIALKIERDALEKLAHELSELRTARRRLYVLGLGGSYANAEHAASDLRKLCEIEALAPNDAEMSAWINDAGREHAFTGHLGWLAPKDALLILSVGGGSTEVSQALVKAVDKALLLGSAIYAIVGPRGGYTAQHANISIRIPTPMNRITPHTEAFQAVIWHLLVSHPILQRNKTTW